MLSLKLLTRNIWLTCSKKVDLALEKMNNGTYGICETCHDSIEEERLLADPLCRNCLDHLSPEERKALESDLDLAYQIQSAAPAKERTSGRGSEHCPPLRSCGTGER